MDWSTKHFAGWIAAASLLAAGGVSSTIAGEQTPVPHEVNTFIVNHCVACHGEDLQEGDLRLDNLPADFASSTTAAKWVEVMDRLNLGEMPPAGEPEPDVNELRAVASWVAAGLRQAEKQAISTGGRVLMRRMNRDEYIHTIQDLLRVEFLPSEDPKALLPPDGTAEGFDKVSAALMLDPSLLDNYFTLAQKIADKAIVDGPPPFETETMRVDFGPDSDARAVQKLTEDLRTIVREDDIAMMGQSVNMRWELQYPDTGRRIPVEGKYRVRFRAAGDPGKSGEPIRMRVEQQHPVESMALEEEFVIDATPDDPQVYETVVTRDPKSGHWKIEFLNGRELGVLNAVYWHAFREGRDAGKEGDLATVMRLQARKKLEGGHDGSSIDPVWVDPSDLPKLYLDWFEVSGPLYDQWPPKSHEMLLFKGDGEAGDVGYVREILTRFMPWAYRRPVKSEEVEPFVRLVEAEFQQGASFNEGLRLGVAAILTSPAFLYLYESDGAEASEGPRSLTDVELASRLSYFLWSSMPDHELFQMAMSGKLSDPQTLASQVNRMLSDEKAERFIDGFASQWLRTKEFDKFVPDEKLYSEYSPALGEAMKRESLEFFRQVLTDDRPVHEFIDSDWTMLNEALAEHYGIPGVEGEEFRMVELPADSKRGGLLGMAGVAMWGSDGNRTKPVSRAVYVREVLFNDPPDPPPPNAGEIEPNIEGENLTIRERLVQHQQIESCAACHRGLDPYGIAMENFNVIGQWREKQDGEDFRRGNGPPIDVSGQLPNGQAFETFEEYKALLADQKDRLARGMAEKMLVYALGRPVEPSDRSLIDSLTNRMAANDFTLRSLIEGLVLSETFTSK